MKYGMYLTKSTDKKAFLGAFVNNFQVKGLKGYTNTVDKNAVKMRFADILTFFPRRLLPAIVDFRN